MADSITGLSLIQDSMVIHNIKASVKLYGKLSTLNTSKSYPNFSVVRHQYTYIIFKQKHGVHHINVTKIPCFRQIEDSLTYLKQLVQQGCLSPLKVDNITATINFGRPLQLSYLYTALKNNHKVRYAAQKFPAIFFSLTAGTALIFASGKLILVGHKTEAQLKEGVTECAATILKLLTAKA